MKNNMYKGIEVYISRGNKPISSASFTFATNPTDQFNNFKK